MAKLIINKAGCKGCGLCVQACPKHLLAVSKTVSNEKGYFVVEIAEQDKCVGCAACAIMCPDSVIEVE